MYECAVVRDDIEDSVENRTRFVYLSREPAPQDLDAVYKTSIVCGIAHDQPGSLLLILSEFAYRFVNLTKIESRPLQGKPWEYLFYIDLIGSTSDDVTKRALDHLGEYAVTVRVLGSYPRFGG